MEDEFSYNGTSFAKRVHAMYSWRIVVSQSGFYELKGKCPLKKAVCVVLFKDKGGFYVSFEECFDEWGWNNCDNILNRTYLKMISLE
jgi:hypothetical protein